MLCADPTLLRELVIVFVCLSLGASLGLVIYACLSLASEADDAMYLDLSAARKRAERPRTPGEKRP